jgi:predicted RNA-binding Zn-ribbon protein involved in translation (DUF1610 family)
MSKVQYACIDCGKLSSWMYSGSFKKTRDKYKCLKCANQKPVTKQAQYVCIDCGELSTLKYISVFHKSRETYKCMKCSHKLEVTGMLQYTCIDCGKLSAFKYKEHFEQPRETYRCQKCAHNTPEYIKNRKILMTEISNRPEVREKRSISQKIRMTDPSARERISISVNAYVNSKEYKDIQNKPEIKLKRILAATESANRPDVKLKKIAAIKEVHNRPEVKLSKSIKMSGCNNPNYKNGSSYLPYCPKFNARRKRAVRDFFDNLCLCCGERQYHKNLSVHHIDHDKEQGCDGKPFNLVPLCVKCHIIEVNNQDSYKHYINKTLREGFKWGIWNEEEYKIKVMYDE